MISKISLKKAREIDRQLKKSEKQKQDDSKMVDFVKEYGICPICGSETRVSKPSNKFIRFMYILISFNGGGVFLNEKCDKCQFEVMYRL